MVLSNLSLSPVLTQLNSQILNPFGLVLNTKEEFRDLHLLSVAELRNLVWEHRFIILRGFSQLELEELSNYCQSWGELLTWDFGTVLDVIVQENPQNYTFTNGNMPFHWDGAFAKVVPSLIFFQCVVAPTPGSGGETTFCDTTKVWEKATPQQRQIWQQTKITYKTQKLAHYGGQISTNLVSQHPVTGVPILRFAEPLNEESVNLNPLFLEIPGLSLPERDQLIEDLQKRLYNPENFFAHQWQTGDILIADNHVLLHGRNPFFSHSSRHLQRVHIL
ncbi:MULTISPECIES: TauD/TfdA dioxygenase family protein [Fischerella]|nr:MULTISPECIES: TauD/TfdA family dioxygenase [Fischerella]